MVPFVHSIAVACGLCFLPNVVSGALVSLSRSEIEANMTTKLALQTVMNMSRKRDHPELVAVLHTAFGKILRGGTRTRVNLLQAESHVGKYKLSAGLRGSSQLNAKKDDGTATSMLSDMEEETFNNLEQENFRCESYDGRTTRQMRSMRDSVINFNAQSASARACVVKCGGDIATFTAILQQTEEEALRFQKDCRDEIREMQTELETVQNDTAVIERVLDLIKCDSTSATDPELLLFQCKHCNDAVMISSVPDQLARLQSGTARSSVHQVLAAAYGESPKGQRPIALAQSDVERMRIHTFKALSIPDHRNPIALAQTAVAHMQSSQLVPDNTDPGLNLSHVPALPDVVDCQPTTKCSIGNNVNCRHLKSRFLSVATGLMDRSSELRESIGSKQSFCARQMETYRSRIETMNTKLRDAQTKLGECTVEQNQAELNAHHNAGQLELTSTEYTTTMTQCCANQNEARSQLCALAKIRGELLSMTNDSYLDIVDCQVSEWRPEECSATCGGGIRQMTRSVLIHPQAGGMRCPPLLKREPCNEDDCPVDCRLGDWGGWSSCSANCGGGVMQRERPVEVEPINGGEACEQTSDTLSCHIESCDVNCVLSDWLEWSACSKACGGGVEERTKSIVTPARGMGHCWEADTPERMDHRSCQADSCAALIADPSNTRSILNCQSKVDVIIVLDGSGSLGDDGWEKSKDAAEKLVRAFGAGDHKDAHVAVLLFGGPETMDAYKKCIGDDASNIPNMETDCKMKWVSHFTTNTDQLATDVSNLVFPRSNTMTSLALGQAENELMNGREDAQSVVIVITDGWPMSRKNTDSAAKALQEKAKVMYVPVGYSAPMTLFKEVASSPPEDHIIQVQSMSYLDHPFFLNLIIGSACMQVN